MSTTRFLTALHPSRGMIWASYDPDALCTAPAVTDRRFSAYVAPHKSADLARAALVDAGCDPRSVTPEPERRGMRARRG